MLTILAPQMCIRDRAGALHLCRGGPAGGREAAGPPGGRIPEGTRHLHARQRALLRGMRKTNFGNGRTYGGADCGAQPKDIWKDDVLSLIHI